jgi:peptidoglycan/LPS O-acetylase OafA/YrhL
MSERFEISAPSRGAAAVESPPRAGSGPRANRLVPTRAPGRRRQPADSAERPLMGFRGDVEGLRAVAVLLVVLDHLEAPGLGGGFFGVDVFFVVSGYLITSLLAAEYEMKAEANGGRGSISITGFYARRIRRILPAALTVIAAVVVAGVVLLNEFRLAQIRHDALWAVLFGSNVNFIRQATDYFAQGSVDTSPFQHYWSLAVEEQFYLVWPPLFLLVTRLTVFGGTARWRGRVATVAAAIGTGSLVWAVVATDRGPAGAYFSTFTRGWEIALGALIAIATTRRTKLPHALASAASAAAVALFVAACVVIGDTTPFPGTAALLPTVATALVIVGGLSDRVPLPNRALCLAPLRFIGRISYSVYLWHWPLIVFAAALYPRMSQTAHVRLLVLLMTLAVAALSFYSVEQPGRRIGVRARSAAPTSRRWRGMQLAAAPCGACLLVVAFVGLLGAVGREGPLVVPAEAATLRSTASSPPMLATVGRAPRQDTTYVRTVRRWHGVIRAGLALRELPESLQPLSPHLSAAFPPPCIRGLPGVSSAECVVGNPRAAHVAVLNGDSHAEMLRNSVWRAFDPKTWSIHIFARSGCGWAGASNGTTPATKCRRLQAEALRRIRMLHPDVLLLSEHRVVTTFRSSTDIASSLSAFRRAAVKTIVLGHTPLPQPWSSCLVGNDISRCIATLDSAFFADLRVERQLAARAGAIFVDTSPWLCVRAGSRSLCPSVVAGVPVFKDDTHISAEYQLKLVPIMRALLISTGLPVNRRLP